MVRDRMTLALLISVPLVQLLLFGYAIDLHPKHLPTALVAYEADDSVARAISDLEGLGYFRVVARTSDPALAERWLAESRVQFILQLPRAFGTTAALGDQPKVTLIADATDPVASIAAVQAAQAHYAGADPPRLVELAVERRFNPAGASRLFIIPGLLGVVLTLTLVLLGAFSMVREREWGTFEALATLPLPPGAILLGKIAPQFLLGYMLFLLLLMACSLVLGLPLHSISPAFAVAAGIFIAANLLLGVALSLLAHSQMQAMQLGVFFYLPSMLLSGFMFPFFGMPAWARDLGELLPLTHFLRIARGILLKNLPESSAWSLIWPIVAFAALSGLSAAILYRRRLS